MRRLVIYCDGGFGNRFNALVSGLAMARLLQLEPLVVWPVNNWCGAAFHELFENTPTVVERELVSFQPERGRYQYLIVEDRLGLADAWVSPLQLQGLQALHDEVDRTALDVFYYTALIPAWLPGDDIAAQVRALRIRREILVRAEAFLLARRLGRRTGDFVGVQIRKTDFGSHGADDQQLFDQVRQCPQQRFFVCSDDKGVEQRFAALPNVAVFDKRAHVEKRVDGDWNSVNTDHSGRSYAFNVERSGASVQDALVDLLILSRSQIVRTSSSTFLNTALLLQQTGATAGLAAGPDAAEPLQADPAPALSDRSLAEPA